MSQIFDDMFKMLKDREAELSSELDRVRQMLKLIPSVGSKAATLKAESLITTAPSKPKYKSLAEAIRSVLPKASTGFNHHGIRDLLIQTYPEMAETLEPWSVTGFLKKAARRGEILVVRRGEGNTPSIYSCKGGGEHGKG